MLEAYFGEEPFRKGIRAYKAKHQYSDTTSADLWLALEIASGKPVEKLASERTTQPGLPLLKVEQACEGASARSPCHRSSSASTSRLSRSACGTCRCKSARWAARRTTPCCPVQHDAGAGRLRRRAGDRSGQRRPLPRPVRPAPFDPLAAQVAKLPDTTRLKLQADAWGMVMADRMQLDSYLKLVAKYGAEPRYAVWDAILNNLTGLDQLAAATPERPPVRRFLVDPAGPKLARLGWDEKAGEAIEGRQRRARLAGVLAGAGDPAAIAKWRARFQRYLADPSSVSPSMIDIVIGVAGRYADQATYDALAVRATQTKSNEERNRFSGALARSSDPALAARTLQMALSPQLPPQLTTRIVPMVAGNEHIDQAWAVAVANCEALVRDRDAIGQNRAFSGIVASPNDAARADILESYVGQHFGPDALAEAKRVGNGIRIRAALKSRLLPQVRAALK